MAKFLPDWLQKLADECDENNSIFSLFPIDCSRTTCNNVLTVKEHNGRKKMDTYFPKARDFISVYWGEEQAPIKALVTEVTGVDSFKAVIMPEGAESPIGPFNFWASDVATKTGRA